LSFTNKSEMHFNTSNYFPNLDRHKNFWCTAKINEDGETYRIHMWADHVPSVDISKCTSPAYEIVILWDNWKSEVSKIVVDKA